MNFESTHGHLPAGVVDDDDDLRDAKHCGWVFLLPYVEAGNVYHQYDLSTDWRSDNNVALAASFDPQFLNCPTSPTFCEQNGGYNIAASDYALSKGPDGFLYRRRQSVGMFDVNVETSLADVQDGLSNTFVLGEAASNPRLDALAT